MKRKSLAFTLVEVLIVVTIISILVSISVVFNRKIQISSRDKERETEITIIANALESYYNNSGEYPGVSVMTNSNGATVRTLLGIKDVGAIVAPTAPPGTTNSIVSTGSSPDRYIYTTAETNPAIGTCATSGSLTGCTKFQLSYTKEDGNTTITVDSRH
jgi:prepilin-type N-terminal cleavage/methylation domain-containing protein